MSAEQHIKFSFSDKTKQDIIDYLKQLIEGNQYNITLDTGSILEIIVNRSQDDKIAIKMKDTSLNFPNGKFFAIIKYAENVKDGLIQLSEDFKIVSVTDGIVEVEASIDDKSVDVVLSPESISEQASTGSIPVVASDESSIENEESSDFLDEFEFDIDEVVEEEEVEIMEKVVVQALSLWDRDITIEKRKALISDLLIEFYKKDKNFSLIDRDVNIFNELNSNKIFIESDNVTLDNKPYHKKLLNKRFNETNIYPIVQDNKIFYSNNKPDPSIDGLAVLPKPIISVKEDEDGEAEVGEITLRIQLIKDYYAQTGGINGYKDYIRKIYEGGNINVSIDEGEETRNYETTFSNLNLTHTPEKDENINHEYYRIDSQKEQTQIFRNCNETNPCPIEPHKDIDNPLNQMQLVSRMTIPMEYYLRDLYDDKYIVDSKGNKKKDVRTCNGTNKTGDSFYINNVDDLKKSISKPPVKEVLYPGETLKVVGFFIESPYNKVRHIIATGEHTLDDNTKVYPKLYNNTLNLGDIGKKKHNLYNVEIIDNIDNFNYNRDGGENDYDPNKNYFVYFNKDTEKEIKKLTNEEYNEFVERIIPSSAEIIDIESDNLKKCMSIDSIDNILSQYGLEFKNLDKKSIRILSKNIIRNIKLSREIREEDLIQKLDTIELNKLFNRIYDTINNLKSSIENHILASGSEINIININDRLKTQLKIYFTTTIKNIKIIKLFLTQFLRIEEHYVEDDSTDNLIDIIVDVFNQREGNILSKSLIDSVINTDSNIPVDIRELITKYLEYNDIGLGIKYQPMNKKFTNNDLTTFAVIKRLKNTLFNGDEFKDIINLINLQAIKHLIDNKYTDGDITRETLSKLNISLKDKKDAFVQEKSVHSKILSLCNGVKVKKIYSSLEEINNDSGKEIYADKDLSKINSIFKTIINFLEANPSLETSRVNSELENLLNNSYMFLTREEVNRYIELFKKTVDGSVKTLELAKGELGSFKEPINDSDYALLNGDKKYLFFRKGNDWISVDKDSYTQIQKCVMFKQESIDMTLEEIENICNLSSDREDSVETSCIKIGDSYIPKPLYSKYLQIEELKNKINLIAHLLTYKNSIEGRISDTRNSIVKKMRITYNKNIQKYSVFDYTKKTEKLKLTYPSKHLRIELNKIYKITDFDMRIEQLLQFISRNGILYSRNKNLESSAESTEHTAKWVYYDSEQIDVPICCKHYLDYEEMLFKDNKTRENVLENIKDKWCKGHTSGNTYICTNCGESIDNLNYSEFEGFGKDNKVINVREKVVDIIDEDEDDINFSLDKKLNIVKKMLGLITNKIGIILKDRDIEFIENFVSTKYLYNTSEFYREIYVDKQIFEKDFESDKIFRVFDGASRDKVLGKITKITSADKFKMGLEELLSILFKEGKIDTKNIYNLDKNNQQISDAVSELLSEKLTEEKSKTSNRDEQKKLIILYKLYNPILKSLINQVLGTHYRSYIVGELVSFTIASLSEILVYAQPAYKLISLGAERREKKSGFFIKKLTKELALEFIYSKVQQESDATRNEPSLRDIYNFLRNYYSKINSDFGFRTSLSAEYRAYLESLCEQVDSLDYMEKLIVFDKFEQSEDKDMIKEYKWSTFLPPLTVNMELNSENLGLPQPGNRESITELINEYNSNMIAKIAIESSLLVGNEPEERAKLIQDREANLVRNNYIITTLHGYYTKLGFYYMSIINRKIFEIDNKPYMLSSYTSSLGYDKLNKKYVDYFIDNFEDISGSLDNIQTKMNEINNFLSNTDNNTIMFRVNNVNNLSRNLQGYMKFNPQLYVDIDGEVNQDKIKDYLIKQLILINTLTILDSDDASLNHQKRNFITLTDDDYNLYLKFKINNRDKYAESEIDEKFLEFYEETKGINIRDDNVKKDLIFKYNGTASYDIVSKRFKIEIENSVIDRYRGNSNQELKKELRSLNVEFNKASLIEKTITYPMINNLVPFKYNTSSQSIAKILEILNYDVLEAVQKVKTNSNIKSYISNIIQAKSENDGEKITETLGSIKQRVRANKFLQGNLHKQKILLDFISMEDVYKTLNNNYFVEIIEHSKNFIKMNSDTPVNAENDIKFKTKLLEIYEKNSDLNVYINILSIVISYLNRVLNVHRSPQNTDGSKLKYLFDDSEANMFLVSGDYARKLDNLSNYSLQLISDSRSDETIKNFLNNLPDTANKIKFINNLLSISMKIGSNNELYGVNILLPTIVKIFIKDIIASHIDILLKENQNNSNILYNVLDDMLNEIVFYLDSVNKTDAEIQETIKLKRKKENTQRKNKFDRMTSDMQNIQKLMRRFNLGAQFAARNDDIEINEEQIYQGDVAEHDGPNLDDDGAILEEQVDNFNGFMAEEAALVMGGADFIDQEEMANVFEEEF